MSDGTRRRFVPEDLYQFVTVGDPQISPDGKQVAFVRTHMDAETREPKSAIWVVPADGSAPPTRYTSGDGDAAPRWSPDGRLLAFLRGPSGEAKGPKQIWLLDRSGGEAWQATTMKHGTGPAIWSPDGKRIAFTSAVRSSDAPDSLTRTMTDGEKKEAEKERQDQAPLYTRLRWRFDPVGIPAADRFSQIWYANVPGPGEKVTDPVQVTWGEYDHGSAAWSPDGRSLAFAARRTDDEMAKVSDVWVVDLPTASAEDRFAPRNVTGGIGLFGDPAFSPDGRYLAVAGHQNEFEVATLAKVYLFPLDGSAHRVLHPDWGLGLGARVNSDVRPGGQMGLVWAPDTSELYVSTEARGRACMWALPVEGGAPRLVVGGDREIYDASWDAARGALALAASDHYNPGDLYCLDLRTGEERRLTAVNADLLAQVEMPAVEEITFRAPDGWEIHGWLMKPVGFEPGATYPLVQQIHGGPATCWGCAFHFEMQLLAANGYGVLFVNPRGSTSYGQEFVNAVRHDYCGKDYLDLMAGVDHALSTGWVDEKRLGVTGGSYGGLMTNWIIGQTDRFAAAITHRSISNWLNFAGVSDIGPWFVETQHGVSDPWSEEGQRKLWDISPIKYAANVTTPTLIMHSEFDYRCPVSEGEQFFMALKFYDKAPVEFLRHPRSNHDLTRSGPPVLRVDRFHHILRWFGAYMPANGK